MQENPSSSNSLIEEVNEAIDFWIEALDDYSYADLVRKPEKGWSIGQVYTHLIEDARFYLDQIRVCVSGNDNADKRPNPNGMAMLDANAFPNEQIEGAPHHPFMAQPESREQITHELSLLRDEVNEVAALISETEFAGRTQHPGLGYFGAEDWLRFTGMHLRHHRRQKRQLDEFLGKHTKHSLS